MHQIFLGALNHEIVTSLFQFFRKLKKVPVFGIISKKLNLELFLKNYSSYNFSCSWNI